METLLIIGLLIGIILGIIAARYFIPEKKKTITSEQSVVILEKIKQVCKLITVEGEFSEIITHRDGRNVFFKMFQFEKKAIIIVKARVLVGFDLAGIKLSADAGNRIITLESFPAPEILSIETDLEYYDIGKGIVNKFSEADLTGLNKKAKELIREKAMGSHLIKAAGKQATETLLLIQQLVESFGWKFRNSENRPLQPGRINKSLK